MNRHFRLYLVDLEKIMSATPVNPYEGQSEGKPAEPTATGSQTDVSLIVRAQNGDQRAWERLIDWCGPVVYMWCRNGGLQPSDADDVFAEVFHSVHLHLEKFERDGEKKTFRRWLNTITHNKICDFYRTRKEVGTGGSDGIEEHLAQAVKDDEDSNWTVAEREVLVHQAWLLVQAEFPEWYAAALKRLVEGDAARDVAHDLGKSTAAVYQAKHRAIQRLRQEFDGLMPWERK